MLRNVISECYHAIDLATAELGQNLASYRYLLSHQINQTQALEALRNRVLAKSQTTEDLMMRVLFYCLVTTALDTLLNHSDYDWFRRTMETFAREVIYGTAN